MKKTLFWMIAVVLLLPMAAALASDAFTVSTETLVWDPDRAFNGYTVFASFGNDAFLIDMAGNQINRWDRGDMNTNYAKLLENGNLMIHGGYPDAPNGDLTPDTPGGALLTAGGVAGRLQERDWDNNIVWDFSAYDGEDIDDDGVLDNATFRNHHDFQRVWNKALGQYTYLALCWWVKGPGDSALMGVDDAYIGLSANGFSPDAIMEFTYDGELVWQWSFNDHMVTADPSDTGTVDEDGWIDVKGRENGGVAVLGDGEDFSAYPNKLNVNGVHYTEPAGPRTDYQHCNSFDYDDATGYIAINAKAASEFFVVDHDGTFTVTPEDLTGEATTGAAIITVGNTVGAAARGAAGDFMYRFGNPSNYDAGTPPGYFTKGQQQMFGTHDIQFIRPDRKSVV